ncbi:MAG: periplasmic heavy metal sensor [Myxococcota bacterium]
MNANEPDGSNPRPLRRRPLFWWPFTLLGMTLALMLFAHRVSAGHGPSRGGAEAWRHHTDRMLDHLLAELEASDEQAEQIRAIADDARALFASQHDQRIEDLAALRAAVAAEPLDREALEMLRREHVARTQALSEAWTTQLADALEVLTPEQRERLITRIDAFRAHRHHHRFGHGRFLPGAPHAADASPANGS